MQVKNIIVYNDYGHIYGGAGKIAFDSALALAQKGYHVVFFCATGPVDSQLEAHGIEVVFLNQADVLPIKIKWLLHVETFGTARPIARVSNV